MTTELAFRPVAVTPDALLALHAARPERYPAFLESAASAQSTGLAAASGSSGSSGGRFDILFACPGSRLTLDGSGCLNFAGTDFVGVDRGGAPNNFLHALDRWWLRERTSPAVDQRFPCFPFMGGWLVYLGYELAGQIEPRLRLANPPAGPIAQAIRIPAAIIHERDSGKAWIIAERAAEFLIETIAADVQQVASLASSHDQAASSLLRADIVEDPPETYLHAVERALEYIAAGDIYQANLSRGWAAQLNDGIKPAHLYQRLRRTNPGPFSGLAVLEDFAVVSSSPERLVSVRDGWVATRPIAGTRPRGVDSATDQSLARELHAHPKERAEHVMLIDLERNDLGRVCEAGTVQVDEFMTIESYAHVHHIVSNVRGRLRSDVTPGQVLAAVFPGGTITGCPKVRCMQIIAELEGTPRGAYTGSLGYLNRDGSMDLNILIRSLEIHGDQVALRAGAGVVADSIPERELEESRAKARGVLRALSEVAA
jgi:anthranilate synthase component 1